MKSNISVLVLIVGTIFVFVSPKSGAEEFLQKGRVSVSKCTSQAGSRQRNSVSDDKCQTVILPGSQACQVKINALSGRVVMRAPVFNEIEDTDRDQFSASFDDRPYQYSANWFLIATKPFTQNVTGSLQVTNSGRAMKVDIFVNHNSQGASYTRVRCSQWR